MSRLASLAVIFLAACGGGSSGPDAGPPDANPFCVAANDHSDLPWIQQNILTPSCSRFSSCHMGRATEAGGLSLEDGKTYDQLVGPDGLGVDSKMYGPNGEVDQLDWKRVVPGDAAHSYLMVILGQKPGPIDPKTGTMPYNSPLLCTEMRDAIERWVTEGAHELPLDAGVPADAGPPDAGP
jgi:hypothetical protein